MANFFAVYHWLSHTINAIRNFVKTFGKRGNRLNEIEKSIRDFPLENEKLNGKEAAFV